MKIDMINGRDLKMGSVFIPAGEKGSFYKVSDIAISKPGKHGSAKSLVTGKNILNGKTFSCTYLDSSEKVALIQDFGYIHKPIYMKNGSELTVDMEAGESIHTQAFQADDQSRLEAAFDACIKNGPGLINKEKAPLVIKYSELGDEKNTLIFWDLVYIRQEDLPRHGITNYVPE